VINITEYCSIILGAS